MSAPGRFTFLNRTEDLTPEAPWNRDSREALWNYNLHYFDDLNAAGAENRIDWHRALIDRWVRENPPFEGVGWDPYPTSLRIVNWIKWSARGHGMKPVWLASLALQARSLRKRLEYFTLANHLLTNAKALVFAGAFFEGEEAEEWLSEGLAILKEELPEQILTDGGHFERSPMYHAIILEDLLDLVNLSEGAEVRRSDSKKLKEIAAEGRSYSASMLRFLDVN
jgi:uncharacterized heparinase superfamily protein